MEQNRALGLLSIARKGGNVELGEENVGTACREGHTRLVVAASDAAENTLRRLNNAAGEHTAVLRVPFTREELGNAVGRAMCAAAAFTDVRLAQAFVRTLGRPEDAAVLADLDERVRRAEQRRQEERTHEYHAKHGKK